MLERTLTRIARRMLCGFLAAGLLCMPSCTRSAQPGDETPPVTGRYLEQARALPEGVGRILDLRVLENGSLALMANQERMDYIGPWTVYTSEDQGESWRARPGPWLDATEESFRPMAACLDAQGGLSVLEVTGSEKLAQDSAERAWVCRVSTLSEAGELVSQRAIRYQSAMMPLSIQTSDTGALLLEAYDGVRLFGAGAQEAELFFPVQEDADIQGYGMWKDSFALCFNNEVQLYSIDTGKQTAAFEAKTAARGFYGVGAMQGRGHARVFASAAQDGETVLYADQNGIYAHVPGGKLIEQIVPAQSTSLNLPTCKPLRLCALEDGSFALLFEEGDDYRLVSYVYDAAPPPESMLLRAYSFYGFHDGRVRQAIGQFEIEHPEFRVDYSVGIPMDAQGRMTGSSQDALHTLNTELLAGRGPDVLVLDRLPVEALVEKGVLADLTDLALARTQSGQWLDTVVENYRHRGRIYGIPTRFYLPLMLGDPADIDSIGSFDAFTRWIERSREKNPDLLPTENLNADWMLTLFYPLCAPAWMGESGSDAALAQFVQSMRRIMELQVPEEHQYTNNLDAGAWFTGKIALAAGHLRSVSDLATIHSLLATGERTGKLALLPGDRSGYYFPNIVVGVNANSAQREAAEQFLETVLSEPVQKDEFFDGMPVNTAVLTRQLTEKQSDQLMVEGMDSLRFMVDSAWPDAEAQQEFDALLGAATTPVQQDGILEGIFFESFYGYLMGEDTLESSLASYSEALRLKQAE